MIKGNKLLWLLAGVLALLLALLLWMLLSLEGGNETVPTTTGETAAAHTETQASTAGTTEAAETTETATQPTQATTEAAEEQTEPAKPTKPSGSHAPERETTAPEQETTAPPVETTAPEQETTAPAVYKLTLRSEGEFGTSVLEMRYGDPLSLPTPTRSGEYMFLYWEDTATGQPVTAKQYLFHSDRTFVAVWQSTWTPDY